MITDVFSWIVESIFPLKIQIFIFLNYFAVIILIIFLKNYYYFNIFISKNYLLSLSHYTIAKRARFLFYCSTRDNGTVDWPFLGRASWLFVCLFFLSIMNSVLATLALVIGQKRVLAKE